MSWGSRRSETGATIVEAAIATPVVALMFFAVCWGALYARTNLTVDDAVKVGDRTATISGNNDDADFDILQSVKSASTGLGKGTIVQVVIYKASDFAAAPSAGCISGVASAGACNVYTSSDLARPNSDFGSGGWAGDNYYPASSRSVSMGSPEFIGVYVQAYTAAAGLGLPTPNTLSRFKVLKIEPTTF